MYLNILKRASYTYSNPVGTWVNFQFVPLASQSPYPIIVYSVANYRPHLSHFWANVISRSQLSHSLFMYQSFLKIGHPKINWPSFKSNEELFTFHLQNKHSGTFSNRKYEELSQPQNPKMCDPTLVTLLKIPSHYSQSRRENATPSSGTSTLARYKEVSSFGTLKPH